MHSNIGVSDYIEYFKNTENKNTYSEIYINNTSQFNDLYNSKIEANTVNQEYTSSYSENNFGNDAENDAGSNEEIPGIENNYIKDRVGEQVADKELEMNNTVDSDVNLKTNTDNKTEVQNASKTKNKQKINNDQKIEQNIFNFKSLKEVESEIPEKTEMPGKVKIIESELELQLELEPERGPGRKIKTKNSDENSVIVQTDSSLDELYEDEVLLSELLKNSAINEKSNKTVKNTVNTNNAESKSNLNVLNNQLVDENRKTAAKVVIIDTRTHRINKQEIDNKNTKNRSAEQNNTLVKSENTSSNNNEIEIVQRVTIDNINKESQAKAQQTINTMKNSNNSPAHRFNEIIKSEVVKNTSMILRDNGKGEIKLILKPESLGNVRIKVLLDNNNIEGRIIVENNNVKKMFESNLSELEQAFREEGFESASLEVSVSGHGADNNQKEEEFIQYAAEEFEKNIHVISEYITDENYINLVV